MSRTRKAGRRSSSPPLKASKESRKLSIKASAGNETAKEVDEPLQHFQICGPDRKWQWAKARITGKDTVTVWHDDITKPLEVRFAWATNPKGANLYNKEGLPTSLFKTGEL